jgi:hypothetical protein
VADEPGDAQKEADEEVRADGAVRIDPDAADQRGHTQRAQDEPDGSSEEADGASGHYSGQPWALSPPGRAQLEQEIGAVPREYDGDAKEQEAVGDEPAEVPAEECRKDRRRRHPGRDPPVNPAGAGVRCPCGQSRRRADCDVRAGRGRRRGRGDEERRQAEAAEDEPDRAADERGHERRRRR